MDIPAEALMATDILTSVRIRYMRGSPSGRINKLADVLIRGWKVIVDEWMDGTTLINPESAAADSLPVRDEELAWHEGLTDLPLPDIDALLGVSFDLSRFFDDMGGDDDDDDGKAVSKHVENPETRKRKLQRNVGRGKVLEVCSEAAMSTATYQSQPEKTQKLESGDAEEKHPRKIQTSEADVAKVKQLIRYTQALDADKIAGGKQQRDTDNQTCKPEVAEEKQPRNAHTLVEAEAKEKQQRKTQISEQQGNLMQTISAIVAGKKSVDKSYNEKLEASRKRLREGYADADNAKRMRSGKDFGGEKHTRAKI